MNATAPSSPGRPAVPDPPARAGMLEDPAHSRQWVARRLQRALTVERWGAPARAGLARGDPGDVLAEQSLAAQQRAAELQALIREVGSVPYPCHGFGARLARAATALLRTLSRRLSARAARRIAEHTLAEYRALHAFVEDAPGVPPELATRIAPLHRQAADELLVLEDALPRGSTRR